MSTRLVEITDKVIGPKRRMNHISGKVTANMFKVSEDRYVPKW